MSRIIPTIALALGCAVMTAHAQDTTVKSRTKTTGGDVRTETYTGCVQTGTQTRSYMLDKVIPVRRTTTTDATGASTATTTFMLIPGEKVEIQEQVGHKVEVTGVFVPAGRVKSEAKTTEEREHGKDVKTREKIETDTSKPEFRVTSIRSLADRCE